MYINVLNIIHATVVLSIPLIFAAFGGLFSERSGIVNIALEGLMLLSAFAAATVAYLTHSAYIGLLAGIGVGWLFAFILAFATITCRADQVVAGFSINFIAMGLTAVLSVYWFEELSTPILFGASRFSIVLLPFSNEVRHIPIIGPLYSILFSRYTGFVYAAFVMVVVAWFVLYRTSFGYRLRAGGHNPAALETAGISVVLMRYYALSITGILAGIAGAYLSIGENAGFVSNMTSGKGYMALAALIFGRWHPLYVLLACLLFGFLQEIAIQLQIYSIFGFMIPSQLVNSLPFLLTILILTQFKKVKDAPEAAGQPYVKGER